MTPDSIINSVLLVLIALAKKQRRQKPCFNFKGISLAYEAHFSFLFTLSFLSFPPLPHKGPPLFASPDTGADH